MHTYKYFGNVSILWVCVVIVKNLCTSTSIEANNRKMKQLLADIVTNNIRDSDEQSNHQTAQDRV